MARRQIGIFINGKQIARSIKSLRGERRKLRAEIDSGTLSEKEYLRAASRVKEINGLFAAHRNQLKAVESTWKKLSKAGIDKFVALTASAFAVSAIVQYGAELFKLGGQMELLANKARTVFGDTLPQVTAAAEANAAAMGLTITQYTNAAAATQDLLIPMGFQREEATSLTLGLVDLSGALSEWTGGQIKSEEVARILSKALLGEREELKQLGISIQEADVQARLAEKGLKGLTGQLLQQAKATATLELITEKSTDAQTAFANNADTIVRRTATMQAKFAEIKANIATALIPIFGRLLSAAEPFVDLITRFTRIPLVEKLEEEQGALNLLVSRITDTNLSQQERNKLIGELQTKYPDFLGNLDAEKVTNDQLADRLREVNDQYIFKIALQKEDDKIQKVASRLANQQRKLAGKDIEIQQKLLEANKQYNLGLDFTNKNLKERIELTIQSLNSLEAENDAQARAIGLTRAAIASSGRAVIEQRVQSRQKELDTLKQVREEIKKNLAAELGIDLNARQPVTATNTDTGIDLEQAAAEEEARKAREKAAKKAAADRQKAAEREIKELENRQEKLQEVLARFQEENRISKLTEDEQKIARLRQRFQKEIEEAKALEVKKVERATELRKALERQQQIEIDQLLEQLDEERQAKESELLAQRRAKEKAEQEQFIEEKRAFEQQIAQETREAVLTEQQNALLDIEAHYQELRTLAEKFGVDTLSIEIAYQKEKQKIQEKFRTEEQKKFIAAAQDQANALAKLYSGLASIIGGALAFVGEESREFAGLTKVLSLAQIAFKSAEAIASATASAAGIPFPANLPAIGTAVATVLGNIAQARKIIQRTPVPQKMKGGWLTVRGQDDNRMYKARYIGQPATGMLPDHPVLINSVTGTPVLGSERGREYFVSNQALKNPVVLNHVRAIENVVKYRQFQDGGATAPLPTASSTSTSNSNDTASLQAVATQLSASLDTLNQILSLGIMAIIPDDTIVGLRNRERKLVDASGGVL